MFVDSLGLEKIILLPPGDPNYPAAEAVADDPMVCLVIAHGNYAKVGGMNAKQLNQFLNGKCKAKQPVKLDACRAGMGENSIAEQLARLRRSTVVAPTDRSWTTPWNTNLDMPYPPMSEDRNSFWNSIPNVLRSGYWREFGPSGPVVRPPLTDAYLGY